MGVQPYLKGVSSQNAFPVKGQSNRFVLPSSGLFSCYLSNWVQRCHPGRVGKNQYMVGYAGTWKEISLPRTSVPVIYSTTLRTNELDNIPTTRLDLRVPGKKYYYLVRNLTTIDRFTTTPAIE